MKGILSAILVFLFFSGCAYEVVQKPTRQAFAASKKRQNSTKNKANLNSNKTNYNANLVYISRDKINLANAYTNESQTRRQIPQKGRNLTLNNLNKIDKTAEQISQRERNLNSNQSEQTPQPQASERVYQTGQNLNLKPSDTALAQRYFYLGVKFYGENDAQKAHSQWAKSCEMGINEACYNLRCLENGYLQTGFKSLSNGTCVQLTQIYAGLNYPKNDYQRARAYYEKGCDLGYGIACYLLAYLYDEGLSVPKSAQRARNYERKGFELMRKRD